MMNEEEASAGTVCADASKRPGEVSRFINRGDDSVQNLMRYRGTCCISYFLITITASTICHMLFNCKTGLGRLREISWDFAKKSCVPENPQFKARKWQSWISPKLGLKRNPTLYMQHKFAQHRRGGCQSKDVMENIPIRFQCQYWSCSDLARLNLNMNGIQFPWTGP